MDKYFWVFLYIFCIIIAGSLTIAGFTGHLSSIDAGIAWLTVLIFDLGIMFRELKVIKKWLKIS